MRNNCDKVIGDSGKTAWPPKLYFSNEFCLFLVFLGIVNFHTVNSWYSNSWLSCKCIKHCCLCCFNSWLSCKCIKHCCLCCSNSWLSCKCIKHCCLCCYNSWLSCKCIKHCCLCYSNSWLSCKCIKHCCLCCSVFAVLNSLPESYSFRTYILCFYCKWGLCTWSGLSQSSTSVKNRVYS